MERLLEYFGVLSGLLYLFLEIRQHRAMWIVGFLTSFVYVFVFFFSKIYADMGLNIYIMWSSVSMVSGSGRKARRAKRMPRQRPPGMRLSTAI